MAFNFLALLSSPGLIGQHGNYKTGDKPDMPTSTHNALHRVAETLLKRDWDHQEEP